MHHLGFLGGAGSDSKTKVLAGQGEEVCASLHLSLVFNIECAVVRKPKVTYKSIVVQKKTIAVQRDKPVCCCPKRQAFCCSERSLLLSKETNLLLSKETNMLLSKVTSLLLSKETNIQYMSSYARVSVFCLHDDTVPNVVDSLKRTGEQHTI